MIKENTQVYESKPKRFCSKAEIVATYVNVSDRILLLKLASHKQEANAWGVPAGKLESNEIIVHGARRELFEETGIEVPFNSLKYLGLLYISKPDIDFIYHLFDLQLDKHPNVRLSHEHQDYKWVTQTEVWRLNFMNGAKDALDYYYRKIRGSKKG